MRDNIGIKFFGSSLKRALYKFIISGFYNHSRFINKMKTYPELVIILAKMKQVENVYELLVNLYNYRQRKNISNNEN